MTNSRAPINATAYWTTAREHGELRSEELAAPGPGEALVRALYSGISKGTEMVVHHGLVPPRVAKEMRAPHQEGQFPGPVKFGYLSVGVVENGPAEWIGQRVFCLNPHQDRYVLPLDALTKIPDGVPSQRAVLTGTVETSTLGSNDFRRNIPRFADDAAGANQGVVAAVRTVAAELSVAGQAATPAQVALAWLLTQGKKLGLPVVPIPGTRKAARIDENLGALTLHFTAAQLETLDAAADAVVGSRSADPNWVSEGRE